MQAITQPPEHDGRTGRRRAGLALWAGLNALSAWGGAIGLMAGVLDFGETLDRRLPFANLVLAGLALAVVVALPSLSQDRWSIS